MKPRDATDELLQAVEKASADITEVAQRLRDAVDRNRLASEEMQHEVSNGGGTDAGAHDE